MDILLIDEEAAQAVIAFLTEGKGAPAMLLIVSWPTPESAHAGMETIKLCQSWEIAGEEGVLYAIGHGWVRLRSGQLARGIYACRWDMEDAYVVSLFVRHSELQGFFLVQPAVNKVILPLATPVPCFLE